MWSVEKSDSSIGRAWSLCMVEVELATVPTL